MKEEDFDLIEASLHGKLGSEEQSAVTERLKTDPAFREYYEEVKLMITAVKELSREKLRVEMSEVSEAKVVKWPSRRIVAIAAALLSFVIAGIWLYTSKSNELFDEFYSPYQTLSLNAPRGNASNYETNLRGLNYYHNQKSVAAIQVADSVLARDPENEDAMMLKALSYLDMKQFPQAIEWFQKIPSVTDAMKWYKALALIGAGDKQEAKLLLDQLVQSNSEYRAMAEQVRKKLIVN